jgi:hypothetical protein
LKLDLTVFRFVVMIFQIKFGSQTISSRFLFLCSSIYKKVRSHISVITQAEGKSTTVSRDSFCQYCATNSNYKRCKSRRQIAVDSDTDMASKP